MGARIDLQPGTAYTVMSDSYVMRALEAKGVRLTDLVHLDLDALHDLLSENDRTGKTRLAVIVRATDVPALEKARLHYLRGIRTLPDDITPGTTSAATRRANAEKILGLPAESRSVEELSLLLDERRNLSSHTTVVLEKGEWLEYCKIMTEAIATIPNGRSRSPN